MVRRDLSAAIWPTLTQDALQSRYGITSEEHCADRHVRAHCRHHLGQTGSCECPAELDQFCALCDELVCFGRSVLDPRYTHAKEPDTCASGSASAWDDFCFNASIRNVLAHGPGFGGRLFRPFGEPGSGFSM